MNLNNCQVRRSAGFTLIELLVVVFLIGLISGFAVLSVSTLGDDRGVEGQLKRLQYQLSLAIEEAVVQGRPVGVLFNERRHLFLVADKSQWSELENNKQFLAQDLQDGWKFELRLSGKAISFVNSDGNDSKDQPIPQVVFFSSGEVEPFELLIVDLNNAPKFRIWYGDDGVIALASVDEG